MEQILKILRQLTGTAGALGSIPKPIRIFMTFFGVFVGVIVIFKYARLGQTEKTFLIIAVVLLAVIAGGYYAWKAWTQKKQNQQFGGEISQHSSAAPRSLSDPGQRARLDDMRKKFQSGVEAYKSRGKDLYKLPWYVIVGEPGSGKTEAVRHSNVGFPPGMQDEFQGVGGTINMNWWFTNHAVLLDTAGRLMFEEVKPGETSEWKEFLNLLKKNRPNCPINGLFLVIPSDSLIKDSADAIQKKAGKIAQQLDVIQRVLDVRFPVFVVVTKCDKINGFREFFDGLTDPQLQHQMMGWSNPNPLDDPFKPEMVDKYIDQVAERLRRRRLGLLRDPVPENMEGRRTDEVDSLYALPHSLELLSSRLRRYLETIFIAGEWSAKPLFLRGIYFSSAMREGAALDAELAEAIGVSVEELPEGKVWERERAYFLRDLFLEKVFREKGLVTRASDTKRMLRGQQIALYGFGFIALAVFCTVAWFAMGNLRSGVKDQGDNWQVVSAKGWENKYWKESIVPKLGDGVTFGSLSSNVVEVDGKPVTLGQFHARLRDVTEKPLKKNLMFPGLADKYNQNSRKAQRIVFEGGVVRPLVEATRQKMGRENDAESAKRQPDALAALIQLEADILARGSGTNKGELTTEGAKKFLGTFQDFVAGKDTAVDTNLIAVMSWVYSTNDAAKGSWPPRWLTGGRDGTNDLANNAGVRAGLDQFVNRATNGLQTYEAVWNPISSLRASAKAFADSEEALFITARSGADAKFLDAHKAVEQARQALAAEIAKASKVSLFEGSVSLTNANQKFRAAVESSAAAALGRVKAINEAALAANPDYPLFRDIRSRLDGVQAGLSNRVQQLLASANAAEFQKLDDEILNSSAFAKRADVYASAHKLAGETLPGSGSLLGLKGERLEKFLKERAGAVRKEASDYTGKLTNEFGIAIGYYLKRAEKAQSDAFFAAYLAEANRKLADDGGFPLVRGLNRITSGEKFSNAGKTLKYISDDLASPTFQKYAPHEDARWKALVASVEGQQGIAKALLGEDSFVGNAAIFLEKMTDTTKTKDQWQGTWRDIKVFVGNAGSENVRTGSETEQKLGDVPVDKKVEFRIYKSINAPNEPTITNSTKEWGPLWLIHRHGGERDKADPRNWQVEVPVEELGPAARLRLKIRFDRVLPERDKWPAQ